MKRIIERIRGPDVSELLAVNIGRPQPLNQAYIAVNQL
jgi:hypothetical protein